MITWAIGITCRGRESFAVNAWPNVGAYCVITTRTGRFSCMWISTCRLPILNSMWMHMIASSKGIKFSYASLQTVAIEACPANGISPRGVK